MKKETIIRLILVIGLVILVWVLLIPQSAGTRHPNWQIVAQTKLRSLGVLYTMYTSSGSRYRHLDSIEDLKEFAVQMETDLSIFTTYDPLNKRETPVIYFKPETFDEDELVFVFEDPIHPREKKSYSDEELKSLRYIASYTKSGVVYLESKPTELTQSEPGRAGNG